MVVELTDLQDGLVHHVPQLAEQPLLPLAAASHCIAGCQSEKNRGLIWGYPMLFPTVDVEGGGGGEKGGAMRHFLDQLIIK